MHINFAPGHRKKWSELSQGAAPRERNRSKNSGSRGTVVTLTWAIIHAPTRTVLFYNRHSHGQAVKAGKGHFNYTPEDLPEGLLTSLRDREIFL